MRVHITTGVKEKNENTATNTKRVKSFVLEKGRQKTDLRPVPGPR